MNKIDAVNQNQNLLLTLLMESMLKPQDIKGKPAGAGPPVTEVPKTDSNGDQVDLLV